MLVKTQLQRIEFIKGLNKIDDIKKYLNISRDRLFQEGQTDEEYTNTLYEISILENSLKLFR